MKISTNWLKDFIEVPKDIEKFSKDIAEHCFEVEKIIPVTSRHYGFSNVKIAKVLHWEKHPNADRLRVVQLTVGDQIIEPVVCGANNFNDGDLVALAFPGATIPQDVHTGSKEPFVLGKATIRGVESQGMICSEFELGLVDKPEEKPEILILPKNAPLGEGLAEYLSMKDKVLDYVLDLSLPANRPDLFSHYGIAREFAGLLNSKTESEFGKVEQTEKFDAPGTLKVDIKNDDACPFYCGMRIQVKVGESPKFIKERLQALGLRSINNVVDITNYVMYEVGEPLHAFDAAKVSGGIVVRNAKQGEKIKTIDHKERELDQTMLVIADKEKTLAVAGIMGGLESEVNATTTEIILEAANFEPTQIRRTSKKLGLRTDGSGYWEKGLHPRQAQIGAYRAFKLLQEHAGAKIIEQKTVGSVKEKQREIKVTTEQVNGLLGSSFTDTEIKHALYQLKMETKGTETISVEIPYYRGDMVNFADIADEILKIEGLNILEKQPLIIQRNTLQVDADLPINRLKDQMVELGFSEIQTYSFVSEKDIKNFGRAGVEEHVRVKNPLSIDQEFLRKHLLISLMKVAAANAKNFDAFGLFEIGKGYHGFLNEPDLLTYVIYDKSKTAQQLFAEAKGVLENLVSKYTHHKIEFTKREENIIDFVVVGKTVGNIGMVDAQKLKNFDVPAELAYCKLQIDNLLHFEDELKVQNFSRFPRKILDISLVVMEDLPWADIEAIVRKNGGDILQQVEVFEADYLYPKDKLPKFHKELASRSRKNIAFHMVFQAENRTLQDSEIMPIYDKIIGELKVKLNAEIR